MDRSSLYLMFVARLLGESVGEEFLDLSGCDVSSLKASVLRKDYDEVTRSLLGKALDEFYKKLRLRGKGRAGPLNHNAGLHGPPRKDYSGESLKIQHRFLNVHLIPLVRYAESVCPGLRTMREILEEDLKVVSTLLHVR
jgi:hypothetical protein